MEKIRKLDIMVQAKSIDRGSSHTMEAEVIGVGTIELTNKANKATQVNEIIEAVNLLIEEEELKV